MGKYVRTATVLLPPFAILLSFSYHAGYWLRFDVDVFQFVSLNQMILASALAFSITIFTVAVGAILGFEAAQETKELISQGKTTRAKFQDAVMKSISIGLFIWGTIAFFRDDPIRAILLGPGIASFLSSYFVDFFREKIDVQTLRLVHLFILLAIMLPFFSFGSGEMNAEKIISGSSYKALKNDVCAQRLVGRAGDFLFLFDPIERTVQYKVVNGEMAFETKSFSDSPCDVE